jgi:hypothetical protein
MTAGSAAEPSPRALGESLAALAAQVADLRGQVRAINERLDQAGLRADLNLADRFEDLAQTVADALDAAACRSRERMRPSPSLGAFSMCWPCLTR